MLLETVEQMAFIGETPLFGQFIQRTAALLEFQCDAAQTMPQRKLAEGLSRRLLEKLEEPGGGEFAAHGGFCRIDGPAGIENQSESGLKAPEVGGRIGFAGLESAETECSGTEKA